MLHVMNVFVALVIRHAKRMYHIISFGACPDVPYFYALSNQEHDFRKIVIEHKIYILIFAATFRGTRWRSLLRHCATSRKVEGSIPADRSGRAV